MMYFSTKTYDHNLGFSCAFRQWRADSHCNQIHGYALAISLVFASVTLDDRNWVQDFGSLKPVQQWLTNWFDHTMLVASDDPEASLFEQMKVSKIANVKFVPSVGCEAFASMIHSHVMNWLGAINPAVILVKTEVREHSGNSAGVVNDSFLRLL